jgi:hypothetical protein
MRQRQTDRPCKGCRSLSTVTIEEKRSADFACPRKEMGRGKIESIGMRGGRKKASSSIQQGGHLLTWP